jgi:hypothetical protein
LILHIIMGFAAHLWFRVEVRQSSHCLANPYLRGSHQRNADRRKEPAKPFFLNEKTHENLQRKTR